MKLHEIVVEELGVTLLLRVGRSQKENDTLLRHSEPHDIWFHLDNVSSPHMVLSTQGLDVPKRYLHYIGTLFPDYKSAMQRRYTVIYTRVHCVKLTKVPGTVIPSKIQKIKY